MKKISFFIVLFLYIIFIFKGTFNINFFQDDYFFLKISRVRSVSDFLNFFSPIREYSYKPLATEVFYYLFHLSNSNVVLGRIVVFITYFIGLIFLYKIIKFLTKKDLLAELTVLIYGLSFIHVFQLYWFATFQEVAVFCFLSISFYLFLKDNWLGSLFFILALLCKETAILYTLFLGLFVVIFDKNKLRKLPIYLLIGFIFWLLYRYSLSFVTALDNYKMIWNPKLLINNSIWYFLWGIGLPNFLPDYFHSIFSKPIATFWEILKIPYTKEYLSLLFIYLILMSFSLFLSILNRLVYGSRNKFGMIKKYLLVFLYFFINFFIFLGPILFFRHKWMIRLTMPFIFIAIMEALIIYFLLVNRNKLLNYLGIFLIITYCLWNFFAIKVHEVSSTYLLENSIYNKTKAYFDKNKKEILKHDLIYLKDTSYNLPKGWNGSEKLINSFAGSSFIDHFIPEKKMKVIFGFQNKKIPKGVYIINSDELLP